VWAKVGGYVIAFVVVIGAWVPFLPVNLALAVAMRKAKRLFPFALALLVTAKTGLAVLAASWLIHKIGTTPTWLMFLIPGGLLVHQDMRRLRKIQMGVSDVRLFFEQRGEPDLYDESHDLRTAMGRLVGDVAGWVIGTALVLPSAPLL